MVVRKRWHLQMTEFRANRRSLSENRADQLQSFAEGEIHAKSKGTGVHSVGVEGRENESRKSARTCGCGAFLESQTVGGVPWSSAKLRFLVIAGVFRNRSQPTTKNRCCISVRLTVSSF